MGNEESSLKNHYGYRLMQVQPNSPAEQAGLANFIDFISDNYPEPLEKILQANINKPIEFDVYNLYTRKLRKVKVTPKNEWGGPGILGAIINRELVDIAHEKAYQLLNMYVDSPLFKAEFTCKEDYILGSEDRVFDTLPELQQYISENANNKITLMVFNKGTEGVRKVVLTPNLNWCKGCEYLGLLGGVLGNGEDCSFPIKPGQESSPEKVEKQEVKLDKIEDGKKAENVAASSNPTKKEELDVNEDDISIKPTMKDKPAEQIIL
jgi:hypothetical protein